MASRLEPLVKKIENLAERFCKTESCPSADQARVIRSLSSRLQASAESVATHLERLNSKQAEQSRGEASGFLSRAGATRKVIVQTGQLRSLPLFRKNIALVFEGPKDSALDSKFVKSKNEGTRTRCERIRRSNPDVLICWAATFSPSIWTAGNMKHDVFNSLIEEMETEEVQTWPPGIREVLHAFRNEESFGASQGYLKFLEDFDNQDRPRKRRRLTAFQAQPVHTEPSLNVPFTTTPDAVSLTGEVYQLTAEDNQAVAHSDQIIGPTSLTIPFSIKAPSFVMTPISMKMSRQFSLKRQRLM